MTKGTQINRSKIDTGTISVVVRNHYCRSILGAKHRFLSLRENALRLVQTILVAAVINQSGPPAKANNYFTSTYICVALLAH